MFAEIIVDVQNSMVDKVFDYKIPEDFLLQEGMRVVVPFGKRFIDGYVIGIKSQSNIEKSKIKSITRLLEKTPSLQPEMLKMISFMVEKYNIKKVDAIRLFITAPARNEKIKHKKEIICFLNKNENIEKYIEKLNKNSKNALKIINYLKNNEKVPQILLNKLFSSSSVNKLKTDNIILTEENIINRKPVKMDIKKTKIIHTEEQKRAIEEICKFKEQTYLLFGVTGSGKTEVYMSVIDRVLLQNKTAILLVPEIALTPQMVGNLVNRFGENIAVLHSGLSVGERFDEFSRILSGEAKVVVGARSAIFAPIKDIGVIIIDEEHESSYNSESNPRYKTYEVAKFRQSFNHCPLVLGSATPSLTTYYETQNGKAQLLELPTRVNQKEMPKIQIVDMIAEIHNGNGTMFSSQLISDLHNCFKSGKQALLFLNRRGYTSFMRCNDCGYIAKCTDCDVPLVYHKEENVLKCHYCGKRFRALTVCPECKSTYIRQGAIGTQKVVDEFKEIFKDIPVFRMDNDTTRTKNSYKDILEKFAECKPAVLVGTQMIAKGHDFKTVSLVGIIDADQSLYQCAYTSPEKTFQLITQVSGRAGRGDGVGKIVLQTYNPKHFVYKYAANYDYKGFVNKELNIRQVSLFPPFASIARVLITNEKEMNAQNTTRQIFNELKTYVSNNKDLFYYFDAMKSPHKKIKNKFRYQVLLRFTKEKECDIIKEIYSVVNNFKKDNSQIFVEIDPQNLS